MNTEYRLGTINPISTSTIRNNQTKIIKIICNIAGKNMISNIRIMFNRYYLIIET